MGCDISPDYLRDMFVGVSIHAPAWGATLAVSRTTPLPRFQSTHPHGVRLRVAHNCAACIFVSIHAPAWGATCATSHNSGYSVFQSTHPHGVRHFIGYGSRYLPWFQSTHPHGVRRYLQLLEVDVELFQSTHPHGVRLQQLQQQRYDKRVSIHAPAWGATQ